MFPDFNSIANKIHYLNNYFYDLKINRFALDLYYSNLKDQKLFLEKKQKHKTEFAINKNLGAAMSELLEAHTGINLYLSKYNKISKRFDYLLSKGITNRRNIIAKLLEKDNAKALIRSNQQQKMNENNENLFDKNISLFEAGPINNTFEKFEIIKGQNLSFLPKSFNLERKSMPTKFDLIKKFQKLNNIKANKKIFQNLLFKAAAAASEIDSSKNKKDKQLYEKEICLPPPTNKILNEEINNEINFNSNEEVFETSKDHLYSNKYDQTLLICKNNKHNEISFYQENSLNDHNRFFNNTVVVNESILYNNSTNSQIQEIDLGRYLREIDKKKFVFKK